MSITAQEEARRECSIYDLFPSMSAFLTPARVDYSREIMCQPDHSTPAPNSSFDPNEEVRS